MAESLDLSHDDLTFLLRAHGAGWRLMPVEPTLLMSVTGDAMAPEVWCEIVVARQ